MYVKLFSIAMAMVAASSAVAQSDLVLLINPNPNEEKLIVRGGASFFGSSDDKSTGANFRQYEQSFALRYGLIKQEKRELYLTVDSHLMEFDSNAVLDQSLAPVPDGLYNVGVGALYRQTVKEDWRVGGQLTVGSSSDSPFNSVDELYLKGLAFLQIPHLEYTSWIVMLAVNTNWQIPVFPGFGYVFPLSSKTLAVVGIPFTGVAGTVGENFDFQAFYAPLRNANVTLGYRISENIRPYVGFRWRGIYFSRADRPDSDDRILFQDKRLLAGIGFSLTERFTVDVNSGYAFDREIGEGDDNGEQEDNNLRIDNTWFAGLSLGYRF